MTPAALPSRGVHTPKRRRLASGQALLVSDLRDGVDDPDEGTFSSPPELVALLSPERLTFSAQALEDDTQAARLHILSAEQGDKSTGGTYLRHVDCYAEWFTQDQARLASLDPRRKALDPFPVTASKVAAFLLHETTRPKVSDFSQPSTCYFSLYYTRSRRSERG